MLFFALEILEIKAEAYSILPKKETKTEEVDKGRQYDQGHCYLIKQLLVSFHRFRGFPTKARPFRQLPLTQHSVLSPARYVSRTRSRVENVGTNQQRSVYWFTLLHLILTPAVGIGDPCLWRSKWNLVCSHTLQSCDSNYKPSDLTFQIFRVYHVIFCTTNHFFPFFLSLTTLALAYMFISTGPCYN